MVKFFELALPIFLNLSSSIDWSIKHSRNYLELISVGKIFKKSAIQSVPDSKTVPLRWNFKLILPKIPILYLTTFIKDYFFRMGRGGGAGRGGGPMHGGMPHVPNHHFQNQNYGQQQQQSGWRFSWMNIIPIYTLCIVGYAIYIYFKGKQIGYDWDSGWTFFF